jgi:nitrite reductase/ring-hydroxylating ferredoxin subunit
MTKVNAKLSGADFDRGVPLGSVKDGTLLLGHAHGEPVIVMRQGELVHAVGAICTHYGAPLADGLLVGSNVRCPLLASTMPMRCCATT